MNSPSLSAMRAWLLWMIAVWGIGRPSGRLTSAPTAYQSARPPMVAASAKAAMKPNIGCTGSSHFAMMNSASVEASTSVAKAFSRRSSAARSASPGVSKEKMVGAFIVNWRLRHSGAMRSIAPELPPDDGGGAKQKARRSGPQISVSTQGARSGGLVVDLGEIVLSGLRTIGGELAEIVGGRLGTRDEHFAARAEQARLDLDGLAERLGGSELVDAREERLGVLVD